MYGTRALDAHRDVARRAVRPLRFGSPQRAPAARAAVPDAPPAIDELSAADAINWFWWVAWWRRRPRSRMVDKILSEVPRETKRPRFLGAFRSTQFVRTTKSRI